MAKPPSKSKSKTKRETKRETKAKPRPRSRAGTPKVDDGVRGEPSVAAASLSSTDLAFVQRVVRFLVYVLDPAHAAKARREGYDHREHAVGWMLLRTAAGEAR
ncbi:MAG: hypothetical protein KDK70_33240, partial [Myxococcales bacterium]|nr:hypothetical protein [Myxococcales bacterium]